MAYVKQLKWVGSSKADLREFPDEVQDEVGHALFEVQCGGKPSQAKPLKGKHGAGVLELVEDYRSDTYRAVYTVEFEEAIYVLHCFQKKSKSGISTPKQDMAMIEIRFKRAQMEHQEWRDHQNKQKRK